MSQLFQIFPVYRAHPVLYNTGGVKCVYVCVNLLCIYPPYTTSPITPPIPRSTCVHIRVRNERVRVCRVNARPGRKCHRVPPLSLYSVCVCGMFIYGRMRVCTFLCTRVIFASEYRSSNRPPETSLNPKRSFGRSSYSPSDHLLSPYPSSKTSSPTGTRTRTYFYTNTHAHAHSRVGQLISKFKYELE